MATTTTTTTHGARTTGAPDWESLARVLARECESARVFMAAEAAYRGYAARTTDARDAATMADWAADARESATDALARANAAAVAFTRRTGLVP